MSSTRIVSDTMHRLLRVIAYALFGLGLLVIAGVWMLSLLMAPLPTCVVTGLLVLCWLWQDDLAAQAAARRHAGELAGAITRIERAVARHR